MILSYFDSSLILTILFDEVKKQEAYDYWINSDIKVSSILLRVETIVSLRRTFEQNKRVVDNKWLSEKTKILDEYLNEVNYRIVDTKIEREIYLNKGLSQCRSLDAIHIATALNFREINNGKDVTVYTYDKMMHNLAEKYNFQTNIIE
jgi:predicted nucleic acid-binding protein